MKLLLLLIKEGAGQQTAYHNPGSRITSYTGNQLLPALYGYIVP